MNSKWCLSYSVSVRQKTGGEDSFCRFQEVVTSAGSVNSVTAALVTSEKRLEQTLQQVGIALATNYRISTLESAAGATTPTAATSSASMVDMHVLGKPSHFAGNGAPWISWNFVMVSFSPAFSELLLWKKARTTADDMRNVNLTPFEQVWSRQLHHLLSLSTSGKTQMKLPNVLESEGAEAWKAFSEHYKSKGATRYVGMLKQILLCELTLLINRIKKFKHLVREYEEQSGEPVKCRPLPGPVMIVTLLQWTFPCSRARVVEARTTRAKTVRTSMGKRKANDKDKTGSRSKTWRQRVML